MSWFCHSQCPWCLNFAAGEKERWMACRQTMKRSGVIWRQFSRPWLTPRQGELEGGKTVSGTERIWNLYVCNKPFCRICPSLPAQAMKMIELWILSIFLWSTYIWNFCAKVSFSLLLNLPTQATISPEAVTGISSLPRGVCTGSLIPGDNSTTITTTSGQSTTTTGQPSTTGDILE